GGSGSTGRGPCFGRCREGHLLVRQRDIAAGEALVAQSAQKTGDVTRLNRMAHIAAVDAVALQPIAMNQRRARMRHRPADDTRTYHAPMTPRDLSSASSGTSGRPMMVK